jgi:predicted transcriptional regulator of viral defense system
MQFFDLKAQLRDFAVFSVKDIKKIDPMFHMQRLSEWQGMDYIEKIRQGFYIFSDLPVDERTLFLIANGIYQPSYISLEMAFSLYHLIPESVYTVTSVTSRKTYDVQTARGHFKYRHLKSSLLFGYELREYEGHRYAVAEIEKAVLDYLYLNPHVKNDRDFDGLRLNVSEFKAQAKMAKFLKYLEAFKNNALSDRAHNFITYINHA